MKEIKVSPFLIQTPSQARVYGMLLGLAEIWVSGVAFRGHPIICGLFAIFGIATIVVRTHDDESPF